MPKTDKEDVYIRKDNGKHEDRDRKRAEDSTRRTKTLKNKRDMKSAKNAPSP